VAVGGAEHADRTITLSAAERAPSAPRYAVLASPAMRRVPVQPTPPLS
jgi:hypothetical protein